MNVEHILTSACMPLLADHSLNVIIMTHLGVKTVNVNEIWRDGDIPKSNTGDFSKTKDVQCRGWYTIRSGRYSGRGVWSSASQIK